jgi:hypothetical protein
MVTAAVIFRAGARAGAARQDKFHHDRRMRPGAIAEWADGAGAAPPLAFA